MYRQCERFLSPAELQIKEEGNNSVTTRPRVGPARQAVGIPRNNGGYCPTQFPALLLSRGKQYLPLRIPYPHNPRGKESDQRPGPGRRGPSDGRPGARASARTENPEPTVPSPLGSGNPFLSSCLCLVPRRCERKLSVTCPVLPASLVVGHLLHLAPSASRLIIPRVRARTGNGYRYRRCLPSLPLRPGLLLPLRHFQRPRPDQNQTRQRKRGTRT